MTEKSTKTLVSILSDYGNCWYRSEDSTIYILPCNDWFLPCNDWLREHGYEGHMPSSVSTPAPDPAAQRLIVSCNKYVARRKVDAVYYVFLFTYNTDVIIYEIDNEGLTKIRLTCNQFNKLYNI